MCGIAGIFGDSFQADALNAMRRTQFHRGPDDEGIFLDNTGRAGLAHNRLSIIDLSAAGRQPMSNSDGTLWIAFNGEVYNYRELRDELPGYPYRGRSDTEVILAAYERWGEACLDRLAGMFSFLIWNRRERSLFAARDRFGVKPLYYHAAADGTLYLASEIRALHAAGVPREPNLPSWATYLAAGHSDHSSETFWRGVQSVEPGHLLSWKNGVTSLRRWYDIAERTGPEFDRRPTADVQEEYRAYLADTIRLRFRSDVPVGINLSGGLDSSLLLGLVDALGREGRGIKAFTFATGDDRYDELPWVNQMLAQTGHPSYICHLSAADVPKLAESVMAHQDEPFGGLPTIAYSRLFEEARASGTKVLLDGQGMDEQWAGYDYYVKDEAPPSPHASGVQGRIQGSMQSPLRPECLTPEFRALAKPFEPARPYPDALRNLQYRDIRYTKIPRALRFNDRASMRSSTELREPFLDHRLVELALRQPVERKVVNGTRKWLLRKLATEIIPAGVTEAPKRALQTPQREWLRGPLREWAIAQRERALDTFGGDWLQEQAVRSAWRDFEEGRSDNSFFIWQWISLGMTLRGMTEVARA